MRRSAALQLAGGVLAASTIVAGCRAPEVESVPGTSTPDRVIALAPSAVEVICALDWCDRLVGVGSYVNEPPETADLPRLGGLVDADLEQILLLEPDLVVALESEDELAAKLTTLGVEVLTVPSDSLTDIGRAAEVVAERFGDPERGVRWRSELERGIQPREVPARPRVLLVTGRPAGPPSRLLVPGEDTYLGELVRRAGADPVFADFDIAYREVDLAAALAAQPEVILEFGFDVNENEGRQAAEWRQVYPSALTPPCHASIGGSHVVVPGPRVVQLYREIVEALERCRSGSNPSTPPGGDKPLPYAR